MTDDEKGSGGSRRADQPERHLSSGTSSQARPQRPDTGQGPLQRGAGPDDEDVSRPLVPGEIIYGEGWVTINADLPVTTVRVENTADRAIQVGSHYHFAEVNPGLRFDRDAAWGLRLNVLSGGSMRFEPGAAEDVELIPIGGQRIVAGLRGECGGELDGRDQPS